MDKRDKPFRDSPRNQAEKQGQGRDTFREAGRSQAQSLRRADSEDRSRNARRGDSEDWSRNARREDTGGQARNARRAERAGGGNRRGPGGPDARQVALMALSDVMHSGAYAQLALSAHLRAARGLSLEDKKLATIIFYGALENRLRIAWVLKQFVEDIPQRAVEDVLHIAAAQLLFLDRVPDHAAVDQAVRQIKALGREQYAALVNGVLRSLIRARDQGDIRYPDPQQDPVRYLSVMHSLPEAITRRLANQYGLEETRAMIAYRPDQRTQTVRPNLLRMDDRAFEEYLDRRGWSWEKGLVPHAYRIRGGGDLAGDPGFREGLFSVQGEGSMLPCYAVAPQRGWQVLDACAAPGGKSSLLCEMMGLTGRVQAWDKHEHRCELLRAAKKRLRLDNLRVAARDATVGREEYRDFFDAVLIDAPCSGLGVMIDKPDIKYRVSEAGIESLVQTQKKILDACAPLVRPGGRLVYSTCTVLQEENQDQIEDFLGRRPDFRLDPDGSFLPPALADRWQDGFIQLQAHRDGVEGFFIARLIREEG